MAPLTVPVGEAKPGETAPRRKLSQKDAPLERPSDIKSTTVADYFFEVAGIHGNINAVGYRDLIDTHVETKKVTKLVDGEEKQVDKEWTFYEMSHYKYIKFPEMVKLLKDYGRGLVKLGLKPNQQDKLHIFAATSHRWMLTFLASATQNIPIVTAYDTLGESGLTHSMIQTESNAVFTDNLLLGQLIKPLEKAKDIRFVIHGDKIDSSDKRMQGKFYSDAVKAKEEILKVRPDIKFMSMDELIELGKENKDIPLQSAKPEDLACIMYTSGSSGEPKGVVLSNANILGGVAGVSSNVSRKIVSSKDRVIGFLPLAHIFELTFELLCFWWGSCIGYANVKTLTDTLCRNCDSDLVEFKPTVMVGVAAVWESVRKGVLAKVKQLPPLTQKLFWTAFRMKSTMNHYHIPFAGAFDIIFKKVKAATGGHLRYVMNGGSPISLDAQIFISTLIAPMLLGYGLTETCANTTLCEPDKFEYNVAGTLTGAVTAKLVDVEEAGYFASNNQGEIWIKGTCVTKEYFKNEKETAEAFTPDGWFKTGDICEWTSNGALKIIDRKKNLVKTLNGEYIALEKLESVYRSNPIVLNLCVYADQTKVKPIAIVIPNENHFREFVAESNIYSESELKTKDLSHFCDDKRVAKAVQKYLVKTGQAQGLKGIELIQAVVLLDTEWTPQNGFVTSAQKLQRRKILESCKDKVDAAYASSS